MSLRSCGLRLLQQRTGCHEISLIFVEAKVSANDVSLPPFSRDGVRIEANFHHFGRAAAEISQIVLINQRDLKSFKPGSHFHRADVENEHVDAGRVFASHSASKQEGTMAYAIAEHGEFSVGLEGFEVGLHRVTMCDRESAAMSVRTRQSNPPPAPATDTAGSARAAADTASPSLPVPRLHRPRPPAYRLKPPARDWPTARRSIS